MRPVDPVASGIRDVGTLLAEQARSDGMADHPVLVFEGRVVTYGELDVLANACARALAARGVGPGTTVALLASNSVEWVVSAFGIMKSGATMASLSTWYGRDETEYALNRTRARVAIISERFLGHEYLDDILAISLTAAPELSSVLVIGADVPVVKSARIEVVSWHEAVSAESGADFRSLGAGDAIGYMLMTSGTTGRPKVARLRQDGLVLNSSHVAEHLGIGADDRCFVPVPLCFARGSVQILLSVVSHGATIVLQRHFDAENALRLIESEKCTVLFVVPQMMRSIVALPGFRPEMVASLNLGRVGHGRADLEYAVEHFGLMGVCNGYGMTEVYGPCALTRFDDPLEDRLEGWCEVLPGVEVKLVDPDTGERVPLGVPGEILVRSYGPPGYFDDPGRNAASFDQEGFFKTGDRGELSESGRLRYLGRYKDMIKVNGLNVSPSTVEQALRHVPGIVEACVFGIPDPFREESVAAAVAVDVDGLDEGGVIKACRVELKRHEVPARVWVSRTPLAKLRGGKLDRRKIEQTAVASFAGVAS